MFDCRLLVLDHAVDHLEHVRGVLGRLEVLLVGFELEGGRRLGVEFLQSLADPLGVEEFLVGRVDPEAVLDLFGRDAGTVNLAKSWEGSTPTGVDEHKPSRTD